MYDFLEMMQMLKADSSLEFYCSSNKYIYGVNNNIVSYRANNSLKWKALISFNVRLMYDKIFVINEKLYPRGTILKIMPTGNYIGQWEEKLQFVLIQIEEKYMYVAIYAKNGVAWSSRYIEMNNKPYFAYWDTKISEEDIKQLVNLDNIRWEVVK